MWRELLAKVSAFRNILKKKLQHDLNLINRSLESENCTSKVIYDRASRLVEMLSRIIHIVAATISPVCYIFPRTILSYFLYFATDSGNEAFELPLLYWWISKFYWIMLKSYAVCHHTIRWPLFSSPNQRFPFDWNNPLGYFGAVIFEYTTIGCHFWFLSCALTFGVGFCLLTLAVTDDVKDDLKIINENAKSKQNPSQTLNLISEFIQLNSVSKQLSWPN